MHDISRRSFVSFLGVFAAASAMSRPFRALAAMADDAAAPLGAYWNAHLDEVARKVDALSATTADAFWFITDLHVSANKMQSGKAIARLTRRTKVAKTLCGGDMPEAFASQFKSDKAGVDFAVDAYRLFWVDPIERAGGLVYTAKGNHDFTIRHDPTSADGHTYSGVEARKAVMCSQASRSVVTNPDDPEACYYYFDNPDAKIRYVVADTTDSIDPRRKFWAVVYGMHSKQLLWLAEKAFATIPAGWSAVVMHHIPLTGCVAYENEARLFAPFRELMEAYQNRGRTTLCGRAFDFADAKGRILLDITGHYHAERQTFQKGVLHVTEPCDAAYGDYVNGSRPWCGELPQKKAGTVHEQTFDAVHLDPARDLVHFTRVGGGQDRAIHLKPIVVKAGTTRAFTESMLSGALLSGPVRWGCYDADRVVKTPNPRNKYSPFVGYANDLATISPDGVLTARRPGEIMVLAMDAKLNKEIFPVTVA